MLHERAFYNDDADEFPQLAASVSIVDLNEAGSWARLQANEYCRGVIVKNAGRPVDFLLRSDADYAERLDGWKQASVGSVRQSVIPPQKHWQELLSSLTIVVCIDGPAPNLRRCLQVLDRYGSHLPGSDQRAQLLVVESAPGDDTNEKICQEFSTVDYLLEIRPGLNFARNRAIDEAGGEVLAFIDQDVQIDRCWLASLLQALSDYPDASAYSGQVLPAELETVAQLQFEGDGGLRLGFESQLFDSASQQGFLYPCDAARIGSSVNVIFRRSILRQLWGFDEALNAGYELPGGGVSDLLYRLIRAGHRIAYEPGILAFHSHPCEIGELADHYRYVRGKSSMAAAVKNFRTDHQNRPRLMLYMGGWFSHRSWCLLKSLGGQYPLKPGILAGELMGGIAGLSGAYRKSNQRVREIKRSYPRSNC
jgi:glycosyltransferase involved in cell wall biosynthesis